ncbi:MAG: YncE family protein [Flavobacterium sp.]|uniref:YncE family protein n=1 Tax=Flavobacterium sp. TaxID=239 RepID=UPI003BA5CE93
MKFSKLILTALLGSFFLFSCTDDDNGGNPLGDYDNGVLILNQGGFGNGNASVSYLSEDMNTFQNNIFSLVNPSIILGDTAQDIGFYNDLAYIVLNASNKIEVVNRYTMVHIATISTGLSNPRYIAFANGKGYVTNWGNGTNANDDFIAVLNLSNNSVASTISVAEGPEKIIEEDNKLYVAHSGGFNYGNTISVINTSTNTVATTITVGDVPNSLEEGNGILYVLCGGKSAWSGAESAGKLVKINLSTNTVSSSIDFAETTDHPSNLVIENNRLFYTLDSDIFRMNLSANTIPTEALFSTTSQGVYGVYSFAVENNKIYVGDALDYSSNGKVYVYSLTGALLSSKTVGVIPAGFYFN